MKIVPMTGCPRRERGFTLIESVLVIGLTMLIMAGVVAGLVEGLDSLHEMTDRQSVEFGHARAMEQFQEDFQSVTRFNNGQIHSPGGSLVNNQVPAPFELVMGYTAAEGEDVWIRYKVKFGVFSGESYLVRTIATSGGIEGTTILASGVSDLSFTYYDSSGDITDSFLDVSRVSMLLTLDIGGAAVKREYNSAIRVVNEGAQDCGVDFNEIESRLFKK